MKRLNFRPEAIIFDMDGVIVDSMPYHFLAWYEALRPWGIRVSCFDVYSREGERWEETLKDLLGRAGIRPLPRTLLKIFTLRQRIFKRIFKRNLFKDVEIFLSCLKNKGYRLGLVTGTPSEEIRNILSPKIRRLFDCIIAGNMVKKGKPHPQPYLKAARELGLRPQRCLVIENAPLGIQSAKRAGMVCIALTSSLPRDYLGSADIVLDELKDIIDIVDQGCAPSRRKASKSPSPL